MRFLFNHLRWYSKESRQSRDTLSFVTSRLTNLLTHNGQNLWACGPTAWIFLALYALFCHQVWVQIILVYFSEMESHIFCKLLNFQILLKKFESTVIFQVKVKKIHIKFNSCLKIQEFFTVDVCYSVEHHSVIQTFVSFYK